MDPFQLALRYLERRARTEQELREKLARRQVPPQAIEAVLAKLKDYGYINDTTFAINWQRYRNDFKPMGVRRIKLELYQKGVAKEIIATVSAEKEAELTLARQAAETRLRQYAHLDRPTFERRLSAFLARRGFDYRTVKQIVDELKPAK